MQLNPQLKHLQNKKQKARKLFQKENNSANLLNYHTLSDQLNTAINSAQPDSEVKLCLT